MHKLAWVLVEIGALNWGLVGIGLLFNLGNWNVVNLIFGGLPWLEAIVYLLVGLSAVVLLAGKGGGKKSSPAMDKGHDGGMDM